MRALVPLLLLGGCAAAPHAAGNGDALARELSGRSAGAPQACVARTEGRTLHAVDRRTLVYRTGDTVWVNRLGGDCPGLGPLSTLIIEPAGARFCRGDRVSGLEPGATIPGPACVLRDFVPYRR